MPVISATASIITPEFVARLGERALEAERLRRPPPATVDDLIASSFTELLVPARYGGRQADFPAILDPVRRMAHGCASSAWTIGFYALHNWMLALFDERAQDEAFATRPFLAPAPLAPTGRGLPTDDGVRLTGRWSWATGVMHGNWIIVGALRGPADALYPAIALVPADDIQIESIIATGDPVPRPVRGEARLAAAHIVHESRAVIGNLSEASGASAHFIDNPLQRINRDVDVICGHVVFDYDTSRQLGAGLTLRYEGATDRNGVKGLPCATTRVIA